MGEYVYAECAACGAVVANYDAHALWHARVTDLVPLLAAAVTTLDPVTGIPVTVVRSDIEAAQLATAATLKTQASAAYESNKTYLALTNPTTAQAVAQVRANCAQLQALIRLAVRAL